MILIQYGMRKEHSIRNKLNLSERKELIVESLKLPKDTLLGASVITITGNREAVIQNYRGILEYTDNRILLQGKKNKICFEGSKLRINYYTNEDMKIEGNISSISYLQ